MVQHKHFKIALVLILLLALCSCHLLPSSLVNSVQSSLQKLKQHPLLNKLSNEVKKFVSSTKEKAKNWLKKHILKNGDAIIALKSNSQQMAIPTDISKPISSSSPATYKMYIDLKQFLEKFQFSLHLLSEEEDDEEEFVRKETRGLKSYRILLLRGIAKHDSVAAKVDNTPIATAPTTVVTEAASASADNGGHDDNNNRHDVSFMTVLMKHFRGLHEAEPQQQLVKQQQENQLSEEAVATVTVEHTRSYDVSPSDASVATPLEEPNDIIDQSYLLKLALLPEDIQVEWRDGILVLTIRDTDRLSKQEKLLRETFNFTSAEIKLK